MVVLLPCPPSLMQTLVNAGSFLSNRSNTGSALSTRPHKGFFLSTRLNAGSVHQPNTGSFQSTRLNAGSAMYIRPNAGPCPQKQVLQCPQNHALSTKPNPSSALTIKANVNVIISQKQEPYLLASLFFRTQLLVLGGKSHQFFTPPLCTFHHGISTGLI